jgi:NAD dependent epimerase/dehydratase
MSRILVTGAGGFIGSHLVEALLEQGHHVRAMVRYTSSGHRGHLDRSEKALQAESDGRLEIALGDITDPYLVNRIAEGQEIILHLAALIGIPYSYSAPASYQAVNVAGTLHILEAARTHRCRRVIITSTSEVYGSARYTPIDEDHPLQGQSPYSASKIAADKLAESYYNSFDLPVVTLRPFNTYGPRQSQRAVIPTILAQALSGASEIKLGNLTPKRDVTYVEDTARAFLLACEAEGIEGETIHFGSGTAHSIGEIAEKCLTVAGSKAVVSSDADRVRPEKSEVECLLCGASKAEKLLGWRPEVSLEQGLDQTAKYIRDNMDQYPSGVYSI